MTVRDVVIVGGGWGVSGLKLIAAAVTREIQMPQAVPMMGETLERGYHEIKDARMRGCEGIKRKRRWGKMRTNNAVRGEDGRVLLPL